MPTATTSTIPPATYVAASTLTKGDILEIGAVVLATKAIRSERQVELKVALEWDGEWIIRNWQFAANAPVAVQA